MGLFKLLLLLCASSCLCQRDCTGVTCPILNNCIEEILESGACCATCLKIGCKCEGYQYYDCLNSGFRSGQVAEGKSYLVDFGSTECSCPKGGGRISCHFIPCPEIPANCIELSEPMDTCTQCKRIGCVHEGQKYEAGHSFRMEPCQVCHCPSDGGNLMCYPVPDCDQKKAHKPVLVTTTEENTPWRQRNNPTQNLFNAQTSRNFLSKLFSEPHSEHVPPFHPTPSLPDEEDVEDYDYTHIDSLEPSLHDLASNRKSDVISVSDLGNIPPHQARPRKQELKQQVDVHEAPTNRPWFPIHEDETDIHYNEHYKDNLQTDTLRSSEGTFQGTQLNISQSLERLTIHQDEKQLSDNKDVTEQPILPKHIFTTDALEEIHRESETLSSPKETTESDMYDFYEDTTHSEIPTDSPVTEVTVVPQTTQETDISPTLQAITDAFSRGEIESFTPETREHTTPHHTTARVEENLKVDQKEQLLILTNVSEDGNIETKSIVDEQVVEESILTYDEVAAIPNVSQGEHETKQVTTPEAETNSPLIFNPTSQSPLTVKAEVGQSKQAQSLSESKKEIIEEQIEERDNIFSSFPKAQKGPALAEVEKCCEAGQKWASENNHCNITLGADPSSVCGVVQEQCCVSALKESRCLAGMIAAKAGETCEESSNSHCGVDTQKECCSCCALGLRFRQEENGCDAHHHLSYPCGHIFLSCCENEDDEHHVPVLKRKESPRPTILPERVADRQFSKQPFSIEDAEHASNSVEKLDVDECEKYKGICHHTCVNTPSSYRCECHPGYILMQDGNTCTPDNLEEDNRVTEEDRPFTLPTPLQETTHISSIENPCEGNGPCSQRCSVVKGQAHCSCFSGFSLKADGQTCEDVNECRESTHNCSLGDICVNMEGSYQCMLHKPRCEVGFIHNQNGECVDLNECVTNTHTCLANERCVNTVGAFVCERQISCQRGYQLRNGVCEDIDECVVRTHNCKMGFQCQNTLGSFNCSPKQQPCLTGFSQDLHGNCIDIDECSVVRDPCTSGFICINTVGSYTCQRKKLSCNRGYHSNSDGTRCVDVDECTTGIHRCTEGQVCHNLPGSHRCECQTGYQYDALRRICVDINECWRYPGRLCAQTCENTVGSYQCACTTGFSLAFDGKNCEDINECDNNPCTQECANIYGSYQCYCRVGYFLKEDGHTCEDIDECSQSIGNMCAFQCVNVQGSYHCACPPQGYAMSPNGHSCQDIDECVSGTHNCSALQTCYNLQGGFRCLSFTCPENYKKVSDIRCERVSCFGTQECQNMPVRITYYQLSFQTNIIIPAQIFRIAPSPAYTGDNIIISILRGNEEGYFSTRRLNSFTGAVYLHRELHSPRDFLIDVEMKLLRQGTISTFLARIYVFITAHSI